MARSHLTGSLLCATALLSACGGGGGGNVASTPPPPVAPVTPAPTPSTPTPAPATTTSVPSAGKFKSELQGPDRDKFEFDYDAPSGIYRVAGYSFGPADSNSSVAEAEGGNFRVMEGDPYGDGLIILVNSSNNSRIVLNYLSYGLYFTRSGQPVSDQVTMIAFVFGTETPSGSMPLTGSATYRGIVDGVAFGFGGNGGSQERLLGSTGSLTANFATGSVNTSLSLQAPAFAGTLSGSGTIGGGTSYFDGSLSGKLNGVGATGNFLGGFYGPNAVEAGYVFNAATGNTSNPGIGVTGAFVGKQ
jgi:hypothetical protein